MKIPKQIIGIIFVVGLVIFVLKNSFIYISPGNVGILINMMTGNIADKPLDSGFKFKLVGYQDIIEYPIFMQTIVLSKASEDNSNYNQEINVNSVEGQPISCDISLSFELDPSKVPNLYLTFRREIKDITQGYVQQTIRQIMQQVVGNVQVADFLGKAKSGIVNKVQLQLQEELKDYGFVIKQFTINEIRPPEAVLSAIEKKNIMAQDALRSKNQLKKVEFEAQQEVEKARGRAESILNQATSQAQANKILSKSINPTFVKYKAIEKWSGKLSEIGSSDMPFIQQNKTK
ncbi:prohibitin family protein [bacterium]|nr:MAG: prohibitin family protein [bacterium]